MTGAEGRMIWTRAGYAPIAGWSMRRKGARLKGKPRGACSRGRGFLCHAPREKIACRVGRGVWARTYEPNPLGSGEFQKKGRLAEAEALGSPRWISSLTGMLL